MMGKNMKNKVKLENIDLRMIKDSSEEHCPFFIPNGNLWSSFTKIKYVELTGEMSQLKYWIYKKWKRPLPSFCSLPPFY